MTSVVSLIITLLGSPNEGGREEEEEEKEGSLVCLCCCCCCSFPCPPKCLTFFVRSFNSSSVFCMSEDAGNRKKNGSVVHHFDDSLYRQVSNKVN